MGKGKEKERPVGEGEFGPKTASARRSANAAKKKTLRSEFGEGRERVERKMKKGEVEIKGKKR